MINRTQTLVPSAFGLIEGVGFIVADHVWGLGGFNGLGGLGVLVIIVAAWGFGVAHGGWIQRQGDSG